MAELMWVSVSVSDCLCLFNLNLNSSLPRVPLRWECLNTREEVYPESDEHTDMHLNTDKKRQFRDRSNTQTPMNQHTQIRTLYITYIIVSCVKYALS